MCTRIESGRPRLATGLGVKRTPSTIKRAGSSTLLTGIEVLPFASLTWPAGPVLVVVVVDVVGVVVVVVVVGAVVVELVVVVVLVLVDPVVLDVDVESVVLDVDDESAAGASGPALPVLAK